MAGGCNSRRDGGGDVESQAMGLNLTLHGPYDRVFVDVPPSIRAAR